MSKLQYADIVDHINHYPYKAVAPAKYTPISEYDKFFNLNPLYQPTDMDMPSNHALTIANMIDMYANNIEFRIPSNDDVFDIYNKLYMYMELLHKNTKRDPVQEVFYQKGVAFLEVCAKKCRLAHKRLDLDKNNKPGTLSHLLGKISETFLGGR